jgi:DNA-binding MarR family transcriptional regulator
MDEGACGSGAEACGSDLTLLVHRAAQGLRCVIDRACRDAGLHDGRDWLVLTALGDGTRRTQLEVATLLAIDKTTLTALLDRLERDGLVVREAHPEDRRARIPVSTEKGREAWLAVSRTRDEVEAALLSDRSAEQVEALRVLLGRFADAGSRLPAP